MIVSGANDVEFLWKAQLDVEGNYKSSIIEIWLHNRVKAHCDAEAAYCCFIEQMEIVEIDDFNS